MHNFNYQCPKSLSEITDLLVNNGSNARLLAGGTDLIVLMRAGIMRPSLVIDAKHVPELNLISLDREELTLGAAVSCRRIWEHAELAAAFPALIESAKLIGGTTIQGRASIGGNLCNASPSADSIPTLIVLSAIAKIRGPEGERELPVGEFCIAPRKNVMAEDEFLVSLSIPIMEKNSGASFLRFIPRNEMDIAVVNAAAFVELSPEAEKFVSVRIAIGSVAPTPLCVQKAGEALNGLPVSKESIDMAAAMAMAQAKPIDDMRGSIEQRKHLTKVLATRTLTSAINRAGGTVRDI